VRSAWIPLGAGVDGGYYLQQLDNLVGSPSGNTTLVVVVRFVEWAVCHTPWKPSPVDGARVFTATLILRALGVLGTSPIVFLRLGGSSGCASEGHRRSGPMGWSRPMGAGKLSFPGLFPLLLVVALGLLVPAAGRAGPPYVTDDPEPVAYQHWEVYVASQVAHDKEGWTGTAPHLEVNYGALPNLHLHLIAPLAFDLPAEGTNHVGLGDLELGAKYRFVQETPALPQVGTFPLVLLPTGNADQGLGHGSTQAFLPLWLQKSLGPWTTYGGGGYWINPGTGNQNYWFVGWQVQRQLTEQLTVGTELFHVTASEPHGPAETRFNVGLVIDLSEHQHLLFSAGRGLQGPNAFQGYLAFLFTFGPRD